MDNKLTEREQLELQRKMIREELAEEGKIDGENYRQGQAN